MDALLAGKIPKIIPIVAEKKTLPTADTVVIVGGAPKNESKL